MGLCTFECILTLGALRTFEAIVINAMTKCLAHDLRKTERVSTRAQLVQPLTDVFVWWALTQVVKFFDHTCTHASHISMHWTDCVQTKWLKAFGAISKLTRSCLDIPAVGVLVPMDQRMFCFSRRQCRDAINVAIVFVNVEMFVATRLCCFGMKDMTTFCRLENLSSNSLMQLT